MIERCSETSKWIFSDSAVLSSFPYTSYPRSDQDPPNLFRAADIQRGVLRKLESEDEDHPSQHTNNTLFWTSRAVSLIVSKALLEPLSIRSDRSLNSLKLFREAVSQVREKQTYFLHNFEEFLDSGVRRADLIKKKEEVRLELEVANIIEKLNMLKVLLKTQRDFLQRNAENKDLNGVNDLKSIQNKMFCIPKTIEEKYLGQVIRMIEDCRRVQEGLMIYLILNKRKRPFMKYKV